jgi:hypothetical protein
MSISKHFKVYFTYLGLVLLIVSTTACAGFTPNKQDMKQISNTDHLIATGQELSALYKMRTPKKGDRPFGKKAIAWVKSNGSCYSFSYVGESLITHACIDLSSGAIDKFVLDYRRQHKLTDH